MWMKQIAKPDAGRSVRAPHACIPYRRVGDGLIAKAMNRTAPLTLGERMRAEWVWADAQRHFARDDLYEALRLVRSITRDPMRPLHWWAFEILLLTLMRKRAAALREVQALLQSIGTGELTPDERYVVCFVQWCGVIACKQQSASNKPPSSLRCDPRVIQLRDISRRWLRLFPLTIHPNWDFRRPRWW
jgi:hypothetical protein